MELKIGDRVRVEKTAAYVSPLSIRNFPHTFKTVMPELEHVQGEGETGVIEDIRTGNYPDWHKYVIRLDSDSQTFK